MNTYASSLVNIYIYIYIYKCKLSLICFSSSFLFFILQMSNNLNHQVSFISPNFQLWTPDHIEDSFSKNLLEQFDRKMNQNLQVNIVLGCFVFD